MKATVIKYLRERRQKRIAAEVRSSGGEVPLTRTTSRAASVHESMYSNRVSFIRRAARKVGFGGNVKMSGESRTCRGPGGRGADHGGGVCLQATSCAASAASRRSRLV